MTNSSIPLGRCRVCGFSDADVDPAFVVALIADLGDRWHALLTTAGRVKGPDSQPFIEVATQHGARVRDLMHSRSTRIQRLGQRPDPALDDLVIDAPRAALVTPLVANALVVTASWLGEVVASTPNVVWTATGTRGAVRVSGAELLHEAIHSGTMRLALARAGSRSEPEADALTMPMGSMPQGPHTSVRSSA